MGIAVHRSFLTYVATVVEVEVDGDGELKIPRVDTAVDAGLITNPEIARAQFEGAAVFGASIGAAARSPRQTARSTSLISTTIPLPACRRLRNGPNVYFVDSDAPPAGIGEPGVPPFVPALCNAIFAATANACASCRSRSIRSPELPTNLLCNFRSTE